MAESKKRKYGEGRAALLAATVAVVADRGLHGLTFRAVAEHAGVNNTLISHHFGTKSALLREAVDWAAARAMRLSDLAKSGPLDPEFPSRLVSLVRDEPELQLFQFQIALESRRDSELRAKAMELYDGYVDAVEELLQRAGIEQNRALARAIFASLDGLVLQQLTVCSREAAEESIGSIRQLLSAVTGP